MLSTTASYLAVASNLTRNQAATAAQPAVSSSLLLTIAGLPLGGT